MVLHDNICTEVFTGLSSNTHCQGLVFFYIHVYYKLLIMQVIKVIHQMHVLQKHPPKKAGRIYPQNLINVEIYIWGPYLMGPDPRAYIF